MFRRRNLVVGTLTAAMLLSALVVPNTFAKDDPAPHAPDPGLLQAAPAQQLNLAVLFDDTKAVVDDTAVNRPIPAVDLVVDGKRYRAEDIRKFDGQALNFVANEKAAKEGVLYAFTSRQRLKAYLEREHALPSEATKPEAAPAHLSWDYYSYFFEDDSYDGKYLRLYPGYWYSDLRKIDRRCYVFWCDSWDNAISSVMASGQAWKTVLYSGPLGTGSTFTFYGHVDYAYLYDGWNNATSSMAVYQ
jgi:hypothetical protein